MRSQNYKAKTDLHLQGLGKGFLVEIMVGDGETGSCIQGRGSQAQGQCLGV
jgi:hypothetical protein